jgi:hypothetical protein
MNRQHTSPYVRSNVIKAQLRGGDYFAFDTIPEMLKAVFD